MARYTTVLSAEMAAYIAETVGDGGSVEQWPGDTGGSVTIALDERARAELERLAEHHDGHVDAHGILWIGGTEYPLTLDDGIAPRDTSPPTTPAGPAPASGGPGDDMLLARTGRMQVRLGRRTA